MHNAESAVYGEDFNDQNLIDSINGIVYKAGLQIGIRAWLDMGSKEWAEINDEQRKQAYNAVIQEGWSKTALKELMLRNYSILSEPVIDLTFEILEK